MATGRAFCRLLPVNGVLNRLPSAYFAQQFGTLPTRVLGDSYSGV